MTLVDPQFVPFSDTVGIIFEDLDEYPERLRRGMYTTNNLNVRYQIPDLMDRWPDDYGVCDDPLQWFAQFGMQYETIPTRYVTCFTRIARDQQPEQGGWRWHKWGRYIGTREQTTEYLHDEPDIEAVYVFRVFRINDEAELVDHA